MGAGSARRVDRGDPAAAGRRRQRGALALGTGAAGRVGPAQRAAPPTWSSRRPPTSRRATPSPATPQRRWTWPRSGPGGPGCARTRWDRTYATAEQYERWFVRDCVRCGRRSSSTAQGPDGRVCRTCQDRAFRTQGRCPDCGHDRLLAGQRAEDQALICTSCAGFSTSYACAECGQEGKLHAGRRCTRCTFTRRVAEILDDGTGRIRPEPAPLAELLTSMSNPLTGLSWVSSRHCRSAPAADLLRGLGRADIELPRRTRARESQHPHRTRTASPTGR